MGNRQRGNANPLKDGPKVEIVYRVAVIQNESALLRSGYNNIIPNLYSITGNFALNQSGFREIYEFKSFTNLNIDGLFLEHNQDSLHEFDAVIIATNATNDEKIRTRLNDNGAHFERFIAANKGLVIFSQKKISSSSDGMVGLLPMELSYKLIERTDDKDSAKGTIARIKSDDYLLQHVSDQTINDRCEKNPFKPHKYRSHLGLLNEGFYEKILCDEENLVDNTPVLLARCKNKKIVVSSMALDQTEQNELLKNILFYTIKGIPTIAFVGVKDQDDDLTNSNFNNLYYTTKLAKYATQDFESFSQLTSDIRRFNIYIVSPSIPNDTVSEFWNGLKQQNSSARKNVKIYRIEGSTGNEKIIREFSNYSAVDLIVDKALLWITSTFDTPIIGSSKPLVNETYFGDSFWISYDALLLFDDVIKSNKYDLDDMHLSFLAPILNKIAGKHFRQKREPGTGSYDDVYNCSCAMLEIFKLFGVSAFNEDKFGKQQFYNRISPSLTTSYVITKFENANIDDKLYAVLSLRFIYHDKNKIFKKHDGFSVYDRMIIAVYTAIIKPYEETDKQMVYALYNEIDISRQIRFITLAQETGSLGSSKNTFLNELLYEHILRLYATQVNGKWQSISKTAIVLKTLIKCVSRNERITDPEVLTMNNLTVTKGINYLVSTYADVGDSCGNWENDVLASINAAHALLLFDLSNNYTIKDFKDSIARESLRINALDTTVNHLDALATLRTNNSTLHTKLREAMEETDTLTSKILSLNKDIIEAKEKFAEAKKKYQDKFELRLTIAITIMVGFGFLYLFDKFNLFQDLANIVKWVFTFVISGIATFAVKRFVDLRGKNDLKGIEDKK